MKVQKYFILGRPFSDSGDEEVVLGGGEGGDTEMVRGETSEV